ncbi:rho guanine nucleotide exchange factor 26 [Numida meleagris]|uniref:rho guanine nucleotide exchange factor 26 n=1 Tax=Numida meleagris TaxID=8996 RepID=UPI000B3DC635|nr:rho guanine nucleotide exchange factor 26 [Numida meleagris]
MDAGGGADLGGGGAALGKRRGTARPRGKPRPQSYQSPGGLLVTDFPVEDRCAFTLAQPAATVSAAPRGGSPRLPARVGSVPAGKLRATPCPEPPAGLLALLSSASLGFVANGAFPVPGGPPPRGARGEAEQRPAGPDGVSRAASPERGVTAPSPLPEQPAVTLSTHSPAARKVGTQQIIPRSLASDSKVTHKSGGHVDAGRRVLKARSMVESPGVPLGADEEAEGEPDSPGVLRRGLRSTSYRRAVVSGIDLDGSANFKKKNRMSQPILKAVVEDKEKFSSLGRTKKKTLKGQGTFDGEENAVLYQNYKEKALDIDSDEESEPREQKSDEKIVFPYKPLRSTWSQLSVVKKNGLSETISQEERKRQEAIFEVISSEHSYLLSLEILIRMFKNSQELSLTMTKTESHHLFSNITDVYEASKKFFKELEARHQNNIFIDDISDIVEKHTSSTFDPYVKYCTNEVYQQRTLQKLLATNAAFKEALSRIESHEDCRNLPMISFLILPMQRVTRLPLLMDTICQKTPKDSPKYENCKQALKEVSKLVRLCNEGARKMERTEMMYTINSQLEFKIKKIRKMYGIFSNLYEKHYSSLLQVAAMPWNLHPSFMD